MQASAADHAHNVQQLYPRLEAAVVDHALAFGGRLVGLLHSRRSFSADLASIFASLPLLATIDMRFPKGMYLRSFEMDL